MINPARTLEAAVVAREAAFLYSGGIRASTLQNLCDHCQLLYSTAISMEDVVAGLTLAITDVQGAFS